MALAPYFSRNTVAASDIIAGFDEGTFTSMVAGMKVGVAIGDDAADQVEGRFCADMLIRLLSRFYPALSISCKDQSAARFVSDLAYRINPNIEISDDPAVSAVIAIGKVLPTMPSSCPVVYIGSHGWDAFVSDTSPQRVGHSALPFGAGAAAAAGCARVFNQLFVEASEPELFSTDLVLSTLEGHTRPTREPIDVETVELSERTALIGVGAIGNGAAWALCNSQIHGSLFLVDHELLELSNLQRYVLAEMHEEGGVKVDIIASRFKTSRVNVHPVRSDWATAVNKHGFEWDQVLVALDSARDRRGVQASLPRAVVNAWTQLGDLGVSEHGQFGGCGACLACLYLPQAQAANEDSVVAQALAIPDRLMDVRALLHLALPTPAELLDLIADRLMLDRAVLDRFRDMPLRSLYVDGICAGALLQGRTAVFRDLHVPVAHQSALAGILLAAAAVRQIARPCLERTSITRLNLIRNPGAHITQRAAADSRGLCICRDSDYVEAYRLKYR